MFRPVPVLRLAVLTVAGLAYFACQPDRTVRVPSDPPPHYEAIDLGSTGGESVFPLALNDSGQVVGYRTAADGKQRAFLWTNGVMQDLGGGFESSAGHTITNSGLVAGVGYTFDRYPYAHVLIWIGGGVTDFGPLWGSDESLAIIGMAGRDDIAVRSTNEAGTRRTALWRNGAREDVGGLRPPSDEAGANAMNYNREMVGLSRIGDFGGLVVYRPFLWREGVTLELPLLGNFLCYNGTDYCGSGVAVDINNSGMVIGRSEDALGQSHGVVWINGAVRALGFAWPLVINEAGAIAGQSDVFGGEGYFWLNGALTRLGSLGGGGTRIAEINNQNMVTGSSLTVDGRPHVFVWVPGQAGLTDLGMGPAGTPGEGALAVAINDRGDIIGRTVGTCTSRSEGGTCQAWGGPSRGILWRRVVP
jgi:probable HAF family extracellular repeat protein